MEIDLILPIVLFMIISLAVLLHGKVGNRVGKILGDKKIGTQEIIFMVLFISVIITLTTMMPKYTIQVLFIVAFSYTLLIFTYLLSKKILLAIIPPIIFVAIYILIKDIFVTNILAAIFAVVTITLLNSLFTWRTALIFATLITVADIIQVFVTGHMIEAASKMVSLNLPIALILPTFPSVGSVMLGLGDVLLSGLLAAQTTSKYNIKAGFLTAAAISIFLLLFEAIIFNFKPIIQGFPATVIVISGWFIGVLPYILRGRRK
ncbi:MAG: hypothetical protein QXU67_06200 [Candidatus Bathyarchaeia archaeon]